MRPGQKVEFKNLGIKVEIHDSYYVLTDHEDTKWSMYSLARRDWLDWLKFADYTAGQPMTIEEFRKIYLTLHISEWISENGWRLKK